jgi:hypothetical protein
MQRGSKTQVSQDCAKIRAEVVDMNELNVVNERFPRHLIDMFREKALEKAMEEERWEFVRELEFEGVRV